MNCQELRDIHHLYVDDELPAPVIGLVDTHLQTCADCRALVTETRTLRKAIQGTARRHTAPPLLTARLRRETKTSPSGGFASLRYLATGWNPAAIAASLLLVVATSVGLTRSNDVPDREEQVVGEVVASHVRSLMGEHLTDVAFSREAGLRLFFAGKVEALPPTIDMAPAGYTLVGGRLDYVADHRCAALVYRQDAHVINLEMWNRDSDRDITESYTRAGYNLVHLTEGDLDYWAVSDLNRRELGDFVRHFAIAAESNNGKI